MSTFTTTAYADSDKAISTLKTRVIINADGDAIVVPDFDEETKADTSAAAWLKNQASATKAMESQPKPEPLAEWERELLEGDSMRYAPSWRDPKPTSSREMDEARERVRAMRGGPRPPRPGAPRPFRRDDQDKDCNCPGCRDKRERDSMQGAFSQPKTDPQTGCDCGAKVSAENEKGGQARFVVQQVADILEVNLGEDILGGDRWSPDNMGRVVPVVRRARNDAREARKVNETLDAEADNLAAALELVTEQRNELRESMNWHEQEIMAAWARIEELEAAA